MQQTRTKRIHKRTRRSGKGDLLGILLEIKICLYYQIVYERFRNWLLECDG